MKNRSVLIRVFAILLLISFFALVFSAITFGTHHCDNEEGCSICAYQIEHRNELSIPVLCACALIISFIASYPSLGSDEGFFAVFTPVKLKVKLSN